MFGAVAAVSRSALDGRGLLLWYYIISFVFLPVIVFLYGRRAWCSFICGTGARLETLGDPYRAAGPKEEGCPGCSCMVNACLYLERPALSG
ncbi:MAG: hypothetical protein JL50_18580 [Peptococcaceae bacterium BICA1-7]|nr:MAG: hypothetical protein JL50_18580 [Peptococcaceae bacterium BICA1-7]